MGAVAGPAAIRSIPPEEGRLAAATAASILLHAALAAGLLIPTTEPPGIAEPIAVDLVLEEPATAPEPVPESPVSPPATEPIMDASPTEAQTPEPPAPESPAVAPPAQEPEAPGPSALPPSAPEPTVPVTMVPPPPRKPRVPVAVDPAKATASPAAAPSTPADAPALAASRPTPTPPSAPATVPTDYAATVNGRLERSKLYPRLARQRREEGTAQVRFTVARDGVVTTCAVTGSTGHDLLDEEACALVRRASPLPPPPGAVPNVGLEMSVPIRFSMP